MVWRVDADHGDSQERVGVSRPVDVQTSPRRGSHIGSHMPRPSDRIQHRWHDTATLRDRGQLVSSSVTSGSYQTGSYQTGSYLPRAAQTEVLGTQSVTGRLDCQAGSMLLATSTKASHDLIHSRNTLERTAGLLFTVVLLSFFTRLQKMAVWLSW